MTKNIKTVVYLVSVVLFISNYSICDYFYPDNTQEAIDGWWYMKSNIHAIVIALVFIASSINSIGVLRFILDVGVGFTISNVVDRLYFNTTEFNRADIVMIAITFIIASIDYKKDKNV
tara:strand:- start:181 stop:534 length:354 start_codon:yes stop_codon:yes gene_type:complete